MDNQEFFSKGKFLLTGEYLVLYGAKALAVPLKFGQRMVISSTPGHGILKWETYVLGKIWFAGSFSQQNFEILEASDRETALFLQKLLKAGSRLRSGLAFAGRSCLVRNHIDFDMRWGLGSSSSLVSNVAWWLDINPYDLYRELYQGSGYDVFCARSEKPIIYRLNGNLPVIKDVIFKPRFSDRVYFVYLGRKQDSQQSVMRFRNMALKDKGVIGKVSSLTDAMLKAGSLEDFMSVMRQHEEIMESVLGMKRVKEELFADFAGEIKSLGAWGGDFIIAASDLNSNEVIDYFSRKDLNVVFRWDEIVY